MAVLYGSCMFRGFFKRKCQTVFLSDGTILYFHQQCVSDPFSTSAPALVLSLLVSLAVLIGM